MNKYNLQKGDFIIWNGRPYCVERVSKQSFHASDEDGGEKEIDFNADWFHSSYNRAKYVKRY